MLRRARIDAPGALHHILVRGIERQTILRDDRDRNRFVDRLGNILSETAMTCYAWGRHLRQDVDAVLSRFGGESATELARGLGMTQPAMSLSVRRGEGLANSMGLRLLEE
jgi:hypothetical protein